jgi:DHA2 family multidrug resistance protein
MSAAGTAVPARPAGVRRAMVTVCAMTATIMQALDTTIANVALPYMQGSLSASLDQINWVLTSYIVASAIMTAPIGWIADRFGRKKLFIACAGGFTFASLLCGLAQNIEQMVMFRLLQGMFGAGLVPLSQAVMLDNYTAQERGSAMAIWGIGVMLGPIMGPTLGAWLTDNYSWHWVFLVNLPVGIVTIVGLILFMDETETRAEMRFDWFGFIALAVGIGSLQVMLDRGEQLGWFESNEIIAEMLVSIAGFYYFFAHSLTTQNPFVRFELFKDRNYLSACLFMAVIGVVLYGTMALITPFMQNIIGYPILTAGNLLAARGVGTLIAMLLVGRLMKIFEARWLVLVGMGCAAVTLYEMAEFTNDTTAWTIVTTGMVQGVGVGFVFVPLSTVAFTTLSGHLRTEGSAILTLVRNIGSSIGISAVIAELTQKAIMMHARLVENVTPFNDALQQAKSVLDMATSKGRAMLDVIVTQQATIMGYDNTFLLLTWVCVAALPFVLTIGSSRVAGKPAGDDEVHAME